MKQLRYLVALIAFTLASVCTIAGGFIIASPPGNHRFTNSQVLETRSMQVNTQITDQIAKTTIDQVFYNPSGSRLEGYFLFPAPKGAVLKNFSMDINGKQMEAELLDANKARKIYEDIVRSMRDPALLEYSEQSLFKVRIFPIEPRSEKRVKITYTEVLELDNNTTEYVFPLNTKKYSAKPLNNVSFKVDVTSSSKIKTLYSPTHDVEIIRKGEDRATIGFEAKNTVPTLDLKVYVGTNKAKFGLSLLSFKEQGEDGFFFANISPGFSPQRDEVVNKDITFVLDVSGSMTGEKMEQAKKALLFCVDHLNPKDRFEIVRFSTEAEALFGKRMNVNTANLNKAKDFIKKLKAIGGTNIDHAFELALQEKNTQDRPHMIIFITDGKPTIGETQEDALLDKILKYNSEATRVFTFGIGTSINTHLLDKITEKTEAYRSYITPEEDIEVKVSNFYTKVSSPVLTDVKLTFGNTRVNKIYPKKVPDIFKGSSVTIFGRYEKAGNVTVTVEGTVNGKRETYTYEAELTNEETNYDFIPSLWATRNIGYLLDQIRLHGEDKELVEEVTRLAKKYGIITPYTSYLILEDERITMRRDRWDNNNVIFNGRFEEVEEEQRFMDGNADDFGFMHDKSGAGSVRSSKEVQELSEAENMAQSKAGAERLMYKDMEGNSRNFADQSKNVQGRAIYQKGNQWIDLYVQDEKNKALKANRVQFNSDEYFELLNNDPKISQFLSLGNNVRFVYNNNLYEVYE